VSLTRPHAIATQEPDEIRLPVQIPKAAIPVPDTLTTCRRYSGLRTVEVVIRRAVTAVR
jgi:hypothetical protein